MKYLVGLIAIAAAVTTAAAQDFKIGTVDMTRVFGEYYKTKDAEKELETRQTEAKKEVAEREEELKALGEKLQGLKKAAEDPGSSPELRRAWNMHAMRPANWACAFLYPDGYKIHVYALSIQRRCRL